MTSTGPLVSCIMPTFNRRPFVPKAIEYFLRQNYVFKQLIIVDDGSDSVEDLVPETNNVTYLKLNRKVMLGEKRNIAIEHSSGDVILHWDDDDWYSVNRIRYQVNSLVNEGADICGLDGGVYYDILEDQFWCCEDRLHKTLFYAEVIGGSICYRRSLWEKLGKFYPRSMLAEDSLFLRKIPRSCRILKLPNQNALVYIRHTSNTWRFACGSFINPSEWIRIGHNHALPEVDLEYYRNLGSKLKQQSKIMQAANQ